MKATDTNLVAEKAAVENEIAQTAADHQERMAALRAKKAEIDDAVLVQTRESAIAAKGAHGKRQIELIHAMCGDEEIRLSETFPDAERLLAECEKHGLEGIVSKRKDAPYRSGKCDWVKVKTKVWREANKSRGELFNPRKPSP